MLIYILIYSNGIASSLTEPILILVGVVPRAPNTKTTGIRNIEYANSIVLKTIEIIQYFNPKYFVIENPQTGLLKHQEFMNEFDVKDVDYCKY